MWCEKCHCGGQIVVWNLDESGNHKCGQCGHISAPLTRSPFGQKTRTLHGKSDAVSGDKVPKKFKFDQKRGTDSDRPALEATNEVKADEKT